jgi:AcrR family transcriptional regulator
MTDPPITRRASYGPSSPDVGARGVHTRQRITDVSLRLFGELGYFDTSVDAIAKAADISRATLYQYFSGKDEIFLELLDDCGNAMMRVVRRIGPLGSDAVGVDNLNWWLGEWRWVFEKYETLFFQWTAIAAADVRARHRFQERLRSYHDRIAERLVSSGIEGVTPLVAAVVMTVLVHRLNLLMHSQFAYGREATPAIDALTVFLQLFLFPETPHEALASIGITPSVEASADSHRAPKRSSPSQQLASFDDRVEGLSKRAVKTVETLIASGLNQFRARGYRRTSVDDIIEAAGVARGTFYKYFSDKADLLAAATAQTHLAASHLAEQIADVDPCDSNAELQECLLRYIEFTDLYSGCIDAWEDATTDNEPVLAYGADSLALIDGAISAMLSRRPLRYPIDPTICALIVRALVTYLPHVGPGWGAPVHRKWFAELITVCIERGFYGSTMAMSEQSGPAVESTDSPSGKLDG